MTFRITLHCDDKKLGLLLRSVSGLLNVPPEVIPVVNVEVRGGKLRAKSDGAPPARFLDYCKHHNIAAFSPKEGQVITKAIGLSPASANYVFGQLLKAGAVKRTGKSSMTRYTVVA